jgi:hypothetical protein
MKNIVLIIPNIFKMLLISNYKLYQAPNTKNSKRYKWRERGSNVVCVVNGALPFFYTRVRLVWRWKIRKLA